MTHAWLLVLAIGVLVSGSHGWTQSPLRPTATLVPAPATRLPGEVDSNSPAVWDIVDGRRQLRVITSEGGASQMSAGPFLVRLDGVTPVAWATHPGHGVWMESIVVDPAGTWYGIYHNEVPANACRRPDRMIPRIGLARSFDSGVTWEDLGIVLEGPTMYIACDSSNRYFLGGVGDASAILDAGSNYLYVFFSQYSRGADKQGIAAARLPWESRDDPVGRVEVWNRGAWLPPTANVAIGESEQGSVAWSYATGTPISPVARPWHDGDSRNDAFWGPSVHWNTFLNMYVMLFSRTRDDSFGQEGVYVAYAPRLEDPGSWSAPELVVNGGAWYPQVIGIEAGRGSDRLAGFRARYFQGGSSNYFIEFGFR
jgi:hypothetical protein